jgi:hypothetical protein
MEDLHAAVSDVVLGPEEDRWTKVRRQWLLATEASQEKQGVALLLHLQPH